MKLDKFNLIHVTHLTLRFRFYRLSQSRPFLICLPLCPGPRWLQMKRSVCAKLHLARSCLSLNHVDQSLTKRDALLENFTLEFSHIKEHMKTI